MKIKILLGLLLVVLIGVGYVSMKKDDYREKEMEEIKKKFMIIKLEECLKKQNISMKNATVKQKEKCKLNLDSQWEEAKILNSQY
jgi:TPP-dependent pyruvate/acetoin dehydrogenase alpha subunit